MKFHIIVIVIVIIGFLGSCRKKNIDNFQSAPSPIIHNTVFTAKITNGESYITPIEKGKTNELPPRYMANHEFGNSGIEVGYQYIGKGLLDDKSQADVYLVSIKFKDKPTEYKTILYNGGNEIIKEHQEIEISFTQGQ